MSFDVEACRRQFPALHQVRDGRTPIFLDGPAGTQVPQVAIDAIVHYLKTCNANHGGVFATSVESDRMLAEAHAGMADLVNAPEPAEIVFGANMTTLTLHLSRALGRTWKPGDEVVVTRLDHDANITPWILAARDAGANVRWADIRDDDGTLDLDDLRRQLTDRTRLVAVPAASNMLGSKTDIAKVAQIVHEVGALLFVDAVHYAPHGIIDVQAWGCDFLACSAYKFFGPHVGILWGRRELLEQLPAYKLRPVPEELPGRWMTGTQNHECLAGLTGTVQYLCDLGRNHANASTGTSRRALLRSAMAAIELYERQLASRLLEGLRRRPQWKVWGIADEEHLSRRVPTIAVTHRQRSTEEVARHLASQQIYCWHGNMYAIALSERLGLEERGGIVRLGLVHYNTAGEVDRLLQILDAL